MFAKPALPLSVFILLFLHSTCKSHEVSEELRVALYHEYIMPKNEEALSSATIIFRKALDLEARIKLLKGYGTQEAWHKFAKNDVEALAVGLNGTLDQYVRLAEVFLLACEFRKDIPPKEDAMLLRHNLLFVVDLFNAVVLLADLRAPGEETKLSNDEANRHVQACCIRMARLACVIQILEYRKREINMDIALASLWGHAWRSATKSSRNEIEPLVIASSDNEDLRKKKSGDFLISLKNKFLLGDRKFPHSARELTVAEFAQEEAVLKVLKAAILELYAMASQNKKQLEKTIQIECKNRDEFITRAKDADLRMYSDSETRFDMEECGKDRAVLGVSRILMVVPPEKEVRCSEKYIFKKTDGAWVLIEIRRD